jgi:hypothetical protein
MVKSQSSHNSHSRSMMMAALTRRRPFDTFLEYTFVALSLHRSSFRIVSIMPSSIFVQQLTDSNLTETKRKL